VADIIKCAWLC